MVLFPLCRLGNEKRRIEALFSENTELKADFAAQICPLELEPWLLSRAQLNLAFPLRTCAVADVQERFVPETIRLKLFTSD